MKTRVHVGVWVTICIFHRDWVCFRNDMEGYAQSVVCMRTAGQVLEKMGKP